MPRRGRHWISDARQAQIDADIERGRHEVVTSMYGRRAVFDDTPAHDRGTRPWAWFEANGEAQREEALQAGVRAGDQISVLVQTDLQDTADRERKINGEGPLLTYLRDEPMVIVTLDMQGFTLRDRFGDRHTCEWGQGIRYKIG